MEMGVATPSVHVTTVEPHVSPTPHVSEQEPQPKVSESDTERSHVVPLPKHTNSQQISSHTSASQGQGCDPVPKDDLVLSGVIALTGVVIFCILLVWAWHQLKDLEF